MMTEIKIADDGGRCSYEYCHKDGEHWIACGLGIFNLCKEHGQPIKEAIERHQLNIIYDQRIKITGGYGDPKSKLHEIRSDISAAYSGGKINSVAGRVLQDLVSYLIDEEKEKEA